MSLEVKRIGTVSWVIEMDDETNLKLEINNAFLIPSMKQRLLPPQQLAYQAGNGKIGFNTF